MPGVVFEGPLGGGRTCPVSPHLSLTTHKSHLYEVVLANKSDTTAFGIARADPASQCEFRHVVKQALAGADIVVTSVKFQRTTPNPSHPARWAIDGAVVAIAGAIIRYGTRTLVKPPVPNQISRDTASQTQHQNNRNKINQFSTNNSSPQKCLITTSPLTTFLFWG